MKEAISLKKNNLSEAEHGNWVKQSTNEAGNEAAGSNEVGSHLIKHFLESRSE